MTEENGVRPEPPDWKENLRSLLEAGRRLVAARLGIFREELSEKGEQVARGCAGLAVALFFGWLALLLLTAFLAVVLSRLLGGPIAGVGATLLLYLLVTAAAAIFGGKSLSHVRPLDFPITGGELSKDWEAVMSSTASPAAAGEEAGEPAHPTGAEEDLESRFRAGSE